MADREQVVASLDRLAVGTMEEVQVGAMPVLLVSRSTTSGTPPNGFDRSEL